MFSPVSNTHGQFNMQHCNFMYHGIYNTTTWCVMYTLHLDSILRPSQLACYWTISDARPWHIPDDARVFAIGLDITDCNLYCQLTSSATCNRLRRHQKDATSEVYLNARYLLSVCCFSLWNPTLNSSAFRARLSDLSDASSSHEPYALSLISQFLHMLK